MSHTSNELEKLASTNQHLVFQDDESRRQTVDLIKSQFSLNQFGINRLNSLMEHACDRELIGHLIAMLNFNISSLQSNGKKLKANLFCALLKIKEQEESIKLLTEENQRLQSHNETLNTTMEKCGIRVALDKCEILKSALTLLKNESDFAKLNAAVHCFSSTPEPEIDHAFNPIDTDDCKSTEHTASPASSSFEQCDDNKRQKTTEVFDAQSNFLPPPFVNENKDHVTSLDLYYRLLQQQQSYRQHLLQEASSD